MITTPTTFVVGAGASKDYGLPTSVELRQEAHKLNQIMETIRCSSVTVSALSNN